MQGWSGTEMWQVLYTFTTKYIILYIPPKLPLPLIRNLWGLVPRLHTGSTSQVLSRLFSLSLSLSAPLLSTDIRTLQDTHAIVDFGICLVLGSFVRGDNQNCASKERNVQSRAASFFSSSSFSAAHCRKQIPPCSWFGCKVKARILAFVLFVLRGHYRSYSTDRGFIACF